MGVTTVSAASLGNQLDGPLLGTISGGPQHRPANAGDIKDAPPSKPPTTLAAPATSYSDSAISAALASISKIVSMLTTKLSPAAKESKTVTSAEDGTINKPAASPTKRAGGQVTVSAADQKAATQKNQIATLEAALAQLKKSLPADDASSTAETAETEDEPTPEAVAAAAQQDMNTAKTSVNDAFTKAGLGAYVDKTPMKQPSIEVTRTPAVES